MPDWITIGWYVWGTIACVMWAVNFLILRKGWAQVPRLDDAGTESLQQIADIDMNSDVKRSVPLVSVIVAAKEEETHISSTIRNLMNQDYPRLEIIAVNDRSTDQTGPRLEELKAWSKRPSSSSVPLHVIHITQLPERWLGKNHAMYQGYLKARGRYLLFTDGDVKFSESTITKAVRIAERERADHLTLMPEMIAPGFWLRAFVHYFLFSLMLVLRPWRNNDDNSRSGFGVGAFNLIRRDAYERIGTHAEFAMYPDDDLELGKRVKHNQMRQRVLVAPGDLQVEWYSTLRKAVHGLEKNMFSGFSYRLSHFTFALIGQLLFMLAPLLLWMVAPTGPNFMFLISAICLIASYVLSCLRFSPRWLASECLVLPWSIVMLCYVMIRSTMLTLARGGVNWRGTFYSLRELKKYRS